MSKIYQLYTIHGIVMGQLVHLMYCLLSKKTNAIYRELFEHIKCIAEKKSIELQVECYRCDFEDACIKALVEAFPDGATECCFFHLARRK